MMPRCQHKWCRKPATIEVGKVYNPEDSRIKKIYDSIYMCSKHAIKFMKKYGGME